MGAAISDCGKYRYSLWRSWDTGIRNPAIFIMLNPSTADGEKEDPTIRRCIGMAKSWSCTGIHVINLFAFRATNPKDMKAELDPVGEHNHDHVMRAIESASRQNFQLLNGPVICAWGMHGAHKEQDKTMMGWIEHVKPHCLGITKDGFPRHPLYVRSDFTLIPYYGRKHHLHQPNQPNAIGD